MLNKVWITSEAEEISDERLTETLEFSICNNNYKRILIIPPDLTRAHSGAGKITHMYYRMLKETCKVDILPALGTHIAMTRGECAKMFGDIPFERFIKHEWRNDVIKIGEAPADFVKEVSEGAMKESVAFELNKLLISGLYDRIISIGQVVPHEVVGMANYTKNLLVGCGGKSIINASHYLGAIYGMERLMGKDHSPVRKLFDYAQEHYLNNLPLDYVLTVTTAEGNDVKINGLFIGGGRESFEEAVKLSRDKNLTLIDEPLKKVLVYLDEEEFKSTWLGNKAIYRTRMAIADDGELIILAPGVERFGEDEQIDKLIRKYGYKGRQHISACCEKYDDLKQNLSAAAHLIHGSSEGRFKITYCPGYLSEKEIKSVSFGYMPLGEALEQYMPQMLKDGFNEVDGEKIFFVSNPALGLWADRKKF